MDEQKPAPPAGQGATDLKPGDTITPHQAVVAPAPAETVAPILPAPADDSSATLPAPVLPSAEPTAPAANQALPSSASDITGPTELPTDDFAISWTASEYIAHSKSPMWYVAVALVVIIVTAAIYLLTHDKITSAIILLAGVAFGFYGARQPRQLRYALSDNGLLIANRYLPFTLFRSFALLEDGAFSSLLFMPLKRFGQIVTIYFDPADEEKILDLLAECLPMEHKTPDPVDRLMRRIRF